VTTWTYDAYRGWLSSKRDANNLGCDYTYLASGRMNTRQWARGTPRIQATYSYDNLGLQTGVTYNDG